MAQTTYADSSFRDCGWCGVRDVAMNRVWSEGTVRSARTSRTWAVLTCPRCAGATLVEYLFVSASGPIGTTTRVEQIRSLPEFEGVAVDVAHLPDDVASFYSDARRVMDAGVPDAAAVQLRKTLEAAAAAKGVNEKSLYSSVEKLIAEGHITQDFAGLLDHVRKIGNIGAHATSDRLDPTEVARAMRFTTQVLRNLFEVPGELALLAEPTAS